MPRPRRDFISLTGRIIDGNGSTAEEVEFVKKKLKTMNQAELIRQAITIYHKYETGQIFQNVIENTMDNMFKKFMQALKTMDIKDINEIINNNEENAASDELTDKEKEFLSRVKRNSTDMWGLMQN